MNLACPAGCSLRKIEALYPELSSGMTSSIACLSGVDVALCFIKITVLYRAVRRPAAAPFEVTVPNILHPHVRLLIASFLLSADPTSAS